jgi:hypothetical protein
MHREVVYSLNHDLTASLVLSFTPIFQKNAPTFTGGIKVKVHPNSPPQHMKVLNYFLYICIDMRCIVRWFTALTMSLQHYLDMTVPQFFKKPTPLSQGYYLHKGAPIYPSTAYQGIETLFIHIIWKWDA